MIKTQRICTSAVDEVRTPVRSETLVCSLLGSVFELVTLVTLVHYLFHPTLRLLSCRAVNQSAVVELRRDGTNELCEVLNMYRAMYIYLLRYIHGVPLKVVYLQRGLG